MDIKFSHICTVTALHNFYDTGVCSAIRFEATAESKNLMRRYALLERQAGGQLEIWTNDLAPDRTEVLKSLFGSNEKLTFVMWVGDPRFMNYTQLPEKDLKRTIYYFSNSRARKATFRGEGYTGIGKEDLVGEHDRVAFHPSQFIYNPAVSLLEETIEITDPDGDRVDASRINYQSKANHYLIDLRDYPDGLYRFACKGNVTSIYKCDAFAWERPFGVLELYFNDRVLPDFRIVDSNGMVTNRSYGLAFENRSTYWKYFFIGMDPEKQWKNLAIVNGKKNDQFAGPVEGQLPNAEHVEVFESLTAMELKENHEHVFRLMRDYQDEDNTGTVVIDRLPNPDMSILKKGSENDPNAYVSEMFIY